VAYADVALARHSFTLRRLLIRAMSSTAPPSNTTATMNHTHRLVLDVLAEAGEAEGIGAGVEGAIVGGAVLGARVGGAVVGGCVVGACVATGVVGACVGGGLVGACVGGASVLGTREGVGRAGRSEGDRDGRAMLLEGFTLGPLPEQAVARTAITPASTIPAARRLTCLPCRRPARASSPGKGESVGRDQITKASEPLPPAYPAAITAARAQYEPRFFVLNVYPNVPLDELVPDAFATIGPEQLPDATRIVTDAPTRGEPFAVSLAVDVSGTLNLFPDLVVLPFATTTFIWRGETTSTVALPEIPPTEAVTDPLPAVDPAVNVVRLPVEGVTAPGAVVDHAAPDAETGFPY